ncbi:hypothetical protein M899_1979 [Bacteriovorax sp. BSW11_IV]|uniref:hypothetical protein n=1 Tax=Bacteriovorax sp. BSW11_IV TaxID=1353529 RepID=UPI00038A3589|nr:hypothetical protein [Bacteriovorax sp. BSW11_IV]EQC46481.1 hypothetical protein M899_1979 [Bacteriovorax sp. BSW11_IV]
MSFCQILTAKQKALEINLDHHIYGTFAEIGAGQEVARNFFQAGGAAGTIAKTISAYDMVVSDDIYGKEKSGRYVCDARLEKMLSREYEQNITRLSKVRDNTQFFAFADTVAAKSYSGKGDCHGWLGVRFQDKPGAEYSEAIIHVRMRDQENVQQQEALGIIGVNLIYACFRLTENRQAFISSLMDGLTTRRIRIDMIRVKGPAFKHVDSRILSLELVKRKFCKAIMFDENGDILQATDYIYKKNLLVLRGSFRPLTHVNLDMLKTGLEKFKEQLPKEEHNSIMVLPEISMSKLIERGEVDHDDFLARIELLSAMGQKVLITSFDDYAPLNEYLTKYSKKNIAFVTGVYNVQEILDLKKYESNPAGILGGLGQLFGHSSKLYVYPVQDDEREGELKTLDTINYDDSLSFLFLYLYENGLIENIDNYNPEYSQIWSRTVLSMIQKGEKGWEKMVPEIVAKTVKSKKLFLK